MRKIVVVSLVLSLLMPWVFVISVYASPGQFDMDIIFVLDNSGSMRYADRHPLSPPGTLSGPGTPPRQAWLAASAANLFIDMASSFDTRVGYVMYTNVITGSRGLYNSEIYRSPAIRQEIQRSIQSMMYGGFTDIALALNHALDIFENERSDRAPAIILLSDGDVHFPNEPATAAARPQRDAGRVAAVDAAHRAASMGIPIHVVGFDFADPHTGEVDPEDEQLLWDIAAAANGTFVFAPEAADLPVVMRDIFAALTGADVVPVYTGLVTGYEQEFTINIPHNSILQASITVMTSRPLEFVYLYGPDGVRLQENEYYRAEDINGLYTKLTMFLPTMGNYTLRFLGTEGDTISIDLLSIYDKVLIQNPPTGGVAEAGFSWRLEDSAGQDIDDPTLIAMLAPIVNITNVATGEVYTHQFPMGVTEMTIPLPAGNYEAYLSLDYGMVTSNTETFTVTYTPPPDIDIVFEPIVSVRLWTIIPILNTEDILLSDVINSPPANWPLVAASQAGYWEDLVEFSFNPESAGAESITILARSAGSADDLRVTVTNSHGESVEFLIEVTVLSGFIILGAIAALLLLILLIVILIIKSKKPFINDPMSKLHIKMSVPVSFPIDPPPEYVLSLPRIKGKKSLRELINMNAGIAEPYRQAFEHISWFADQAILSAKTRHLLEIKIPHNPAFQVKVDKMARPFALFDKNGGTEIRIGFENPTSGYDEYVIELGNTGMHSDYGQSGFRDDSFDYPGANQPGGAPVKNDDFW